VRVVRVVRHLMRLVWGDDLDPALRPVLGVTLIGSAAGSAMWTFMSIWAIEELGAKAALPFALLVGAVLSALSGFAGGYLSDRIGRRRVILIGNGVMVGYPLLLFALSDAKWAGLAALAFAGVFGALGGSVGQAMVADLVAPERRQAAYASVRVAANMGVVVGRRSAGSCSSSGRGLRCSRASRSCPRPRGWSHTGTCHTAATSPPTAPRSTARSASSSPTGASCSSSARQSSRG